MIEFKAKCSMDDLDHIEFEHSCLRGKDATSVVIMEGSESSAVLLDKESLIRLRDELLDVFPVEDDK